MRIVGALLLVCAGALGAHGAVQESRDAQQALWELSAALEKLAWEIQSSLCPLPRLLSQRGMGSFADRFFSDLQSMETHDPDGAFSDHWCAAVAALPLGAEEKLRLRSVSAIWSAEETKLLAALTGCAQGLRSDWERRRAGQRERERLTRALYLSGSLLLLIFLI